MNIRFDVVVNETIATQYTLTPEQIIAINRCIKRNEPREDGTKPSIPEYMIETVARVGDSWKQLVVEENNRIYAEELTACGGNVVEASAKAQARINALNQ